MRVITGAGLYSITQSNRDPQVLRVASDTASGTQAARDGIALMSGGVEVAPGWDGALYVERDVVGDWLAYEVRQFITYRDIGEIYESLH